MNHTDCRFLNTTICVKDGLSLVVHFYLIALVAICLIVIGLMMVLRVVRLLKRRRRRKNKFVKHTSIRGSTRSSSFGGSYNVRTQDQMQLPMSQSRFEYVDMLAQTPTTLHAWSEDNLAAGFEQRSLERCQEHVSTDPLFEGELYNEQGTARERERARTMSEFAQPTMVPIEQHSGMQRGSTARASTRSMPGMAVNLRTEAGSRKRTRSQTGDFQHSVQQSRHRTRSMFDPLPDIPTESQQANVSVDEPANPTPEVVVTILSPDSPERVVLEDQITTPRVENRVSCTPSERNFQFEDGFLLHADVPPFLDPDITMANRAGSTQEINIYSSQILATVEGNGEEQAVPVEDPGEVVSSSVAEDNTGTEDQLYNRLDRTRSSRAAVHFAIQEPERSQPEGSALYSQLVTESPNSSLHDSLGVQELEEESEVLYDRPVIVSKVPVGGERSVNLKDLFDDPGYTHGMMGGGLTNRIVEQHQSETECAWENSEASSEANDNVAVTSPDLVEPINAHVVQYNPRVPVNMESLPLLDYQASELDELDPDVASCLASTENLNSPQISYV